MKNIFTAKQIRNAEENFFISDQKKSEILGTNISVDSRHKLMLLAASEVARAASCYESSTILIVVGPGNNGGDGLFAGAQLALNGKQVYIWLASKGFHKDGLVAALSAGCQQISGLEAAERLTKVDLVIDAFLGIGSRLGLPKVVADFAAECQALNIPVLAVDLPSGLDAERNEANDTFWADKTITFAGMKMCHVAKPAAQRCGEVNIVDIGVKLPDSKIRLAEPADVAWYWPKPKVTDDKYSRGVVGMDIGSEKYPGAAVLGVTGACYSGAGMVRYFGRASAEYLLLRRPNIVIGSGRVQAIVAGSGWGECADGQQRVLDLLELEVPVVLDADALRYLPKVLHQNVLLTPHAGELANILGCERSQVVAQPIEAAREVASRWDAVVLLKGATQYSVMPNGEVTIAVGGPVWTGQAGSGDVLAGIAGALLALGAPTSQAGWLAASAQAIAAQQMIGPYPPDIVIQQLPALIAQWCGN